MPARRSFAVFDNERRTRVKSNISACQRAPPASLLGYVCRRTFIEMD